MTIRASVFPARELDRAQVELWVSIQEAAPTLASPFLRPEFTMAVAEVRPDAYVALLEHEGRIAGFFPYQRGRLPIAIPVGGQRSNYQGVIAAPELEFEAVELLRSCHLQAWEFHHLITTQPAFRPFYASVDASPVIDLSDGFDGYMRERELAGSKVIRKLRQQRRRVERELGPVRFVPHSPDREVLQTLMRWKSRQYQETGSDDRFAIPWNVELLERVHAQDGPGFQGLLPALYVGEELAAVAMCLQSGGLLHYWFPTYRTDMASFSPGLLLLLELIERAGELGIHTVDLGKGHAPYKDRLANQVFEVAQGTVVTPSAIGVLIETRARIEDSLRRSPLRKPLRAVASTARRHGAAR